MTATPQSFFPHQSQVACCDARFVFFKLTHLIANTEFEGTPLLLRRLSDSDEPQFLRAVREWPVNDGMEFAPKYVPTESFISYVHRLDAFAAGVNLPDRWVPSETLFGFVGQTIVGRLQLRFRLNDFLWNVGGQIGYVVLPRFRRRGFAREMLRQGLERASQADLKRVLITCDPTNYASRRLIETAGGIRIGSAARDVNVNNKLRYLVRTAATAE